MGDFFKPLRRKIGVLTLLISLTLMWCWMRSNVVGDVIEVGRVFSRLREVRSERGDIWWMSFNECPSDESRRWQTWIISSNPNEPDYFRSAQRNELPWHQRWQIRFEKHVRNIGVPPTTKQYLGHGFMLPYAYVVIPFTLLSAYLLLSIPCQKPSLPQPDIQP